MENSVVVVAALLSVCSGGLSEANTVHRTVALEGQTAVLPCTFTFTGTERLTIEWTKDEDSSSPNFVFLFRGGREEDDMRDAEFLYRTNLFQDELRKGNASLRISDVSLSDAGKYKCKTIQGLDQKESEVELFVGGISEANTVHRTVALVRQTAVLPCTFTFTTIEHLTIEWTKDEESLSPNIVFLFHSGHEEDDIKNPKFWYRTNLVHGKLRKGNASLRISNVSLSDAGKYKCKTFQDLGPKESEVELFVGAASEPRFLQVSITSEGVSLRCEATCWFPEPQMTLLDEQGKVINAENPTTERRNGCFTVTAMSTVLTGGRFICRVHQSDMNLTRETEIYIPTESRAEYVKSILVAVAVLFLVAVIIIIICVVFRRRLAQCVFSPMLRWWLRRFGGKGKPKDDQTLADDNIQNKMTEQAGRLTDVKVDNNIKTSSNDPSLSRSQTNVSKCSTDGASGLTVKEKSPKREALKSFLLRQHSAPAQLSNPRAKHRTTLTNGGQ